jgi:sugar phosphate isomerase/epimerase
VGVALDTSHVLNGGGTIEQALARYGPRVRHVHLRDYRDGSVFVTPGDGIIDFAEVFAGLAALGYRGGFSAELEYEEESAEISEREAVRALAYFHRTMQST